MLIVDEDLAASVRSSSSRSSIDASEEAGPTSHHPPTQDGGTALPKVVLDTNLHCTPMEVFKLCYDDDVFMKQFRDKESGIKGSYCFHHSFLWRAEFARRCGVQRMETGSGRAGRRQVSRHFLHHAAEHVGRAIKDRFAADLAD